MIDLIMRLSLMQWVFIGAGVLMMIPSIRNVLLSVVNRIRRRSVVVVNPTPGDIPHLNNLTSIVAKWETLNNACIDAGLVDAQDRLYEVFLVLVKDPVPSKHVPVAPDKGSNINER